MTERYQNILSESPQVKEFVKIHPLVTEPVRLESKWRSGNDIYLLHTTDGQYVLKRINQSTWNEDIKHQERFSKAYPGFPPDIHIKDGRSFIMDYIQGQDLLKLMQKPYLETHAILESVSEYLKRIYSGEEGSMGESSATSQIVYTYKYEKFGPSPERSRLKMSLVLWENTLDAYPSQIIHNDLHTGNVFVDNTGRVRSIDPRGDVYGIRDVAKDLGRLLAAVTCATFDNKYSIDESLAVANAILEPWRDKQSLLTRTAFYVGQSYLSFSRWDTKRLAKESLFLIGLRVLERNPREYAISENLANNTVEALFTKGYSRE